MRIQIETNKETQIQTRIKEEEIKLRKKTVKELRQIISRSHRVVDLRGYDKSYAIYQILEDEFGSKAVNNYYGN